MSTVLVTDVGRGSAVSIMRSLGRAGYRVIAADANRRSAGYYSRHATARVRYPSPAEAPEETVEALLDAVRRHAVDLVVPVTDEVILPLAASRERFEGLCALALPENGALAHAADKNATLELAAGLGIPVPRTALVSTADEAVEAAGEIGWPVVVKPQSSVRFEDDGGVARFGVRYAGDERALRDEMARCEGRCEVLLQEYYRGEGHGVELLLEAGRPLAAFQHRRLREIPLTGGMSSFRESVPLDPVLLEQSVRLLEALDWTGLAMVEFKVGPGGPKLMEVNGRVWGSLPLAVMSGMDFPARLADLYLGAHRNGAALDTSYRVGVRAHNLDLELLWIGNVLRGRARYPFIATPRRRAGLAAALRLLVPGERFDILSWRDPVPGLYELGRIVAKLRRKVSTA